MSGCPAKIRPFFDDTEVTCGSTHDSRPEPHWAVLRESAMSAATIVWLDDDRRSFEGEWEPCSRHIAPPSACSLPNGHRGRCVA